MEHMSNSGVRNEGERPEGIRHGSPEYQRATLAMLAVGLATFNSLYSTQAILPTLVTEMGISESTAALTVSAATGALALFVVPASILSERLGRGKVLTISVLLSTLLGLLVPLAPSIGALIALRALQGMALAGVPAVAMSWLSEEIHADDLTRAMGLYIAGNTMGGITGRMLPAIGLEFTGWRGALAASAVFALALAVITVVILPPQQRFRPRAITPRTEFFAMISHWRNPKLAALFITAACAMGAFVSLYNYVGFRMIHTFGLSEGLVGVLYLMYLSGTWSSARSGRIASRLGRSTAFAIGTLAMLLGLALCIPTSLPPTLLGLLLFTAGFFLVHSLASSWVGRIATQHRAEGSSMYLFCYYVGSSVLGWVSGFVFTHAGWPTFIGWLMAFSAAPLLAWAVLRKA